MTKKLLKKHPKKSKTEKKLTIAQALRLASKLEQKGFIISESIKKKIVSNIARKITFN